MLVVGRRREEGGGRREEGGGRREEGGGRREEGGGRRGGYKLVRGCGCGRACSHLLEIK